MESKNQELDLFRQALFETMDREPAPEDVELITTITREKVKA